MRRFFIICAVMLLLVMLASCSDGQPDSPDVTLPALITTLAETTTEETSPNVTTPEETTPEETSPEETTPAVIEPDFENNPDPDGTKRY